MSLLTMSHIPAFSADNGASPEAYQLLARQAIGEWLIPRYETFINGVKGSSVASQQLCQKPNAQNVKAAQKAFSKLQLDWAAVNLVDFGLMGKDHRHNRVYFWPDRHGTAGRQFRKAIATKNYGELEAKNFNQLSAALQGLGTAEKLLFTKDAERDWHFPIDGATRKYSCAMLDAINANIYGIGVEVTTAWRRVLRRSAPTASTYTSPEDDPRKKLYGQLLKATITEAELTSVQRLGKALGKTPEDAKPKRAEAYRQGLSVEIIKASLASSRELLLGTDQGDGFPGLIQPIETSNMKANLSQRFDRALETLNAIKGPLDQAVIKDRDSVKLAQFAANDLVEYLKFKVAKAAGYEFTFNALDGD